MPIYKAIYIPNTITKNLSGAVELGEHTTLLLNFALSESSAGLCWPLVMQRLYCSGILPEHLKLA